MTRKHFCAAPGRRLLACSLASALILSGVGFVGPASAGSERSMDASDSRSVATPRAANTRRAANTPRSDSTNDSESLGERPANTDRDDENDIADSLNWSAPMTREDGSKLYPGEIDGYKIYYRRPGDKTFQSITVSDGSSTSYQLGRLQSGVYEFSVTTLDTDGLESRRSRIVSARLE